jgi:hypothetical protein
MNTMTRAVALIQHSVAALLLMLALGGCYNASNHKLAQSVQESFKGLRVSARLNAEKERSKEFLKQEIEVVQRQQVANRDLALAEAIDSDWTGFRDSIHDRAKELLGNRLKLADLRPAADAIFTLNEQRKELGRREKQMAEELSIVASCPLPVGLKLPADTRAREVYAGYEKACREYLDHVKKVSISGGDLAEVRNRIDLQEGEIKAWEENSAAAMRKYVAAVRDYETHRATQQATAGALKTRRALIQSALVELNDAGPIGQAAAMAERYSQVQALIEQKRRIDAPDAGPKSGPVTVPEILSTSILTIAQIQSSQGLSLLELEGERLRVERMAAQGKQRSAERRLRLLYAEQQALFAAVFELSEAFTAIEVAIGAQAIGSAPSPAGAALPTAQPPKAAPRTKAAVRASPVPPAAPKCIDSALSVAENFVKASGACKRAIAQALIRYSNVWTVGRNPAAQARWMSLGAIHEEAIDESLAALRQWENVLAFPISQLVVYHGSGIKTDTLVQLVLQAAQALSVAVIAAGVTVP